MKDASGLTGFPPALRDTPPGLGGAVLGVVFFFAVYGVRIVDPRVIDWLLHGDPAWHYLGYAFHRAAGWTWPLGAVPGFGAPEGTTLVFSDSIPLLAIALKPFAASLPVDFQYFGAWMLLCHLLQGLFAERLLRGLGVRGGALWGGVFLVVASPALALRAYGHLALMAHWLMLASFEACVARRPKRHAPLLLLAALIHAYWLPMLAPFALLGWWRDRPGWRHLIGWAAAIVAAMAAAGYFVARPGELRAEGYGEYSANLLTLFDPMDWRTFLAAHGRSGEGAGEWSRLLPPLGHAGRGQYEGFAYLGAGAIAALAVAVLVAAAQRLRGAKATGDAPSASGHALSSNTVRPGVLPLGARPAPASGLTALLTISALMSVFALSTRVTLGPWVLVAPELPAALLSPLGVFRATGRFVWPLALLLVVWACARIGAALPGRGGLALMLLLVALQGWDLSGKWAEFGRRFAPGGIGAMPHFSEPGWSAALGRDHLVVLPARIDPAWIQPALFAARHGMTINLARVARGDPDAARRAEARALDELRQAAPRPDTAYWVRDADLAAALPPTLDTVAVKHPLGQGVLIVARTSLRAPASDPGSGTVIGPGSRPVAPVPALGPVR